jgi:large subunit ribosomal protein L3
MINEVIGRKVGMTQFFRDNGSAEGVTVVEAGPCVVVQLKTEATDGYNAAQLGFGKAKKLTSAEKGHLKDLGDFRYLRESRLDDISGIKVGDSIDVSLFQPGDRVDITGITKGKGYAGVVKRHGFHGGPKTHGQSDRHRAPGSIGSTTTPGRVLKGRRMAGRMGNDKFTARNLEVIQADKEKNILIIRGSVPGGKNGLLIIGKSVK